MGKIIRTHFAFNHGINLWLGVSIENNDNLWRVDELLKIPAAVRFVSYEPALDGIDFARFQPFCKYEYKKGSFHTVRGILHGGLDWIICGAESGPGARPMKYEWAYDTLEQCQNAGIPFFYKQGIDDNGNWCKMPSLQGIIWDQMPEVK